MSKFRNLERQASGLDHHLQMSIALHDIRNLLFLISGNIELLLMDSTPGRIHDRLVVVRDAIHSAGTLAKESLRTVQSVENSSSPALVNLSQVVGGFLSLYSATVPPNVRFEVDVPDDPITVFAEGEHIQFIVMNLIENAVESIHRSPGSIRVRVFTSDGHAVIDVADDGPGLPIADVDRLFQPHESFGKGVETRGLGLSSVKESIRRMSGDIEVQSEAKRTRFTIFIPLA